MFAAFNSNASLIASLVLLTWKEWLKFRSVCVYNGMRAPVCTLPSTKLPTPSWLIFAQVPRWPQYWQDEVLSNTATQVDFGVPCATVWVSPKVVSIPSHFNG